MRVQPRASRNEIVGLLDGAVRIRLQAPPVEGLANEALVEFLADRLGVSRRMVRVVSGTSSRSKTVEVDGVTRDHLARLIPS
ncbi:MAG TPA: DUF167 domain-containing protein [Gemmatimonadaceae bacterium]|nr:DUF167 domain-containing protein [Gemmatimonadaceae bacterium]